MGNSWRELLNQESRNDLSSSKTVLVICSPTVETQRKFEKHYLPQGCEMKNESMLLLGFTSATFKDVNSKGKKHHIIDMDIYSVRSPVDKSVIALLRASLGIQAETTLIKWCFLFDWEMSNQKTWLRQLSSSYDMLRGSGFKLSEGSINVICLSADQIYIKQKYTTEWHSQHIELIQQTLRSFCLLKKCSLLYTDSTSAGTDDEKHLFMNLVSKNYREITPIFVNPTRIIIPYGSDTVGLIKTLNDTFDPSNVLNEEFISEDYEKVIPDSTIKNVMQQTNRCDGSEVHLPFSVDVQEKLSKLYHFSQKSSTLPSAVCMEETRKQGSL